MSIYRTCPNCGANLDPGERCDCVSPPKSQAFVNLDKKTPAGATNTDEGKETPHSSWLLRSPPLL